MTQIWTALGRLHVESQSDEWESQLKSRNPEMGDEHSQVAGNI